MRYSTALSALALCLAAGPATAFTLELPAGAAVNGQADLGHVEYALPVAPFADDTVQTRILDGMARKTAWRFPLQGRTTANFMEFFAEQAIDTGFEPLLDCADERCGGFDFRFRLDLLPEPDMHVDLGDFRLFSARRDTEAGAEHMQLVVSRSLNSGYAELTHILPAPENAIVASTMAAEPEMSAPESDLIGQLQQLGHALLDDLSFTTGSSELAGREFASLEKLAAYLNASPDLTVALVGHTDAVGSLDANVALSRQRARSVADRLSSLYGIAPERIEAEGVGYLAPIASNQTEEGRAKNRRVEVVVTSTRQGAEQ